MPPAARVNDSHRCLMEPNGIPHQGGPILSPAASTVLIGIEPAARVGDKCECKGGLDDVIISGEPTVLIRDKPAARLGDATDGGFITSGCTTVLIGPHRMIDAFRDAARKRKPFVEKSSRAKIRRG